MDTPFVDRWTKEDPCSQCKRKLLKMYPKYSKKAFNNLVTGDETWVYYFEPKWKCSNWIWATKNARHPIIAKRTRTVKKVLYVIFFDNKDPVMVPKSRTVTAKFYKNVVLRKLKKYYKTRRPKEGLKHLRLLHDNAPAHKAHLVTEFLESEKVTILPHPPFLPDLAPCDYFLFPKLKYHLSGKRYNSRNALGSEVYQYLMGVPIECYQNCFQKWTDRLKRCTVMSSLSWLSSPGKFAIQKEFWGNRIFSSISWLDNFKNLRSGLDLKIWEPMYRNNRIPTCCSGNNLIGDLFSHPEIIRWSTSLSNRRLNLFEKVWYFPKHKITTGETLMFYLHSSSETN